MKKTILGGTILVLVVVISGIGYFIYQKNKQTEPITDNHETIYYDKENEPICTLELKSCEDGTVVARTGPNCEFAKCPSFKPKADFVPTEDSPIELPNNIMTVKECTEAGGEVINTLEKTDYEGELIAKIEELFCPCACLIRNPESNILWVNKNGNIEEFTGNVEDIQTFDDCKNAGFEITNSNPEICTVGKPHMTDGRYKVFYNNPMETGKSCSDYTYSNCPGSCVAKCVPSSCSEPWIEDGEEIKICTEDCEGSGSCVER